MRTDDGREILAALMGGNAQLDAEMAKANAELDRRAAEVAKLVPDAEGKPETSLEKRVVDV